MAKTQRGVEVLIDGQRVLDEGIDNAEIKIQGLIQLGRTGVERAGICVPCPGTDLLLWVYLL